MEQGGAATLVGSVLGRLENASAPTQAEADELARRVERVRSLGGLFAGIGLSEAIA